MGNKMFACAIVGILATIAIGFTVQPRSTIAHSEEPKKAPADAAREADVVAIEKNAKVFSDAFAKGDAKAIAAVWTEPGELHEANGVVYSGRDEIERAFAELFKEKSQGTIEVDIRSIRFPSKDTAIEEGFLRHTPSGPGLPSSTMYTASHVREGDKWQLAYSREYGAGEDRLGDLAFLLGKWEGGPKGHRMTITFEHNAKSPYILGKFERTTEGKLVASGTLKIGLDAQRGQIRSWHFDDDGGQGQCLWIRDGKNWVLDAMGVTADGTETGAVNMLSRLSNDAFTWRSIDRVVGGESLPDTAPVKLTRVSEKK